MKSRSISVAALFLLVITACHQRRSSARSEQDPAGADSARPAHEQADSLQKNYFPVADYLQSEINYVDSTPLAIVEYNIQGNRTDSAFIRADMFNRLAREFILPELAPENLQKNYSESAFQDETTGYLTFTYSPRDKGMSLRRIDVMTVPGTSSNKVKSIYLENTAMTGDTPTLKKMFWQARKSFQVITTLEPPGKTPVVRQLKVVWDTNNFEGQ